MFLLTNQLRRLSGDERGTIAIIFAICILVVLFGIGVAIDTGRAVRLSGLVTAALDSASLAAAKSMAENDVTEAEAAELAKSMFAAHLENEGGGVEWSNFQADIDKAAGKVKTTVSLKMPTTFTQVLDRKQIAMTRSVTAMYKIRDVEISLVLDVTGSMGNEGKMDSLKLAAKDLVDIVLEQDFNPHVRLALAPYSASVNVGAYAAAASDGVSADGCVIERTNFGHAYTEVPPGPGSYFSAAADPVPANIDPLGSVDSYKCPDAVILPLSNNKTLLKTTMDSFNPDGWTAGHLGAAWGWYLLSPNWSGVWPAASVPKAYDAPNLTKAVIFMTDGIFNTAYNHDVSADAALRLCTEMKAQNVIVYTIAFKAPAEAEATLLACATSPAHFFSADNGDALRATFKSIGGALSALRLAN